MPIVPGVLLIEGLAQTGGILLRSLREQHAGSWVLATVRKARFVRSARPDDELLYNATVIAKTSNAFVFEGTVKVDGVLMLEAELCLALAESGTTERP